MVSKISNIADLPKGKEFEEYISAFFQCGRYYIERNIIERECEEVLELDIIATNYSSALPKIYLIEVKSGNWGFRDLFKIRGWLDYLNISNAIFIANKEKNNKKFFNKKFKMLNIDLIIINDLSSVADNLVKFTNNIEVEKNDLLVWTLSYSVERNLVNKLNHKKKSCDVNTRRFKVLEDYYFNVNSKIFFTGNIIRKVQELYSLFKKYPHVSAKCGSEIEHGNFDSENNILSESIYKKTYYKCSYNDIQLSTFIEHKARLAILKNAVDYKLYKKTAKAIQDISLLGSDSEVNLLPGSFKEALNSISEHKYFSNYPIFWQWFMWVFGGFILKDYEEKEYEILSFKTGIPIEEIPNALNVYNVLFPQENGWFLDLYPNSNIKILKMFSVPFMGIGAIYRAKIYTTSGKLEDLKLTGNHTIDDLIKWAKLTNEILNKKGLMQGEKIWGQILNFMKYKKAF